MKEHGILFSAPMVRALLARRKTQTRRMSKQWLRVKAGDVLWVRENWWKIPEPSFQQLRDGADTWPKVAYDADESDICREQNRVMGWKLKPSIHMPRWASRIALIATEDAREQELWDVKAWECVAEGIEGDIGNAVPNFVRLWDSLHGKEDPWASNPTVVRLAFRDAAVPALTPQQECASLIGPVFDKLIEALDFNPSRPKAVKSIP